MPWCGSAEPKVDQTPITPPQEARESPPKKLPHISPHLQDILEEDFDELDEDQLEEEEEPGEEVCIVASYNKYYYGKKRGGRSVLLSQSPSPTYTSGRRGILRSSRSVASSAATSGPTASSILKMQAEQGSIGDLQKYHNKYLRNRRHTLANVR